MGSNLAKLTPPQLAAVYPRDSLFQQLDAWQDVPAIWISAPAGSGKTTLTGSYLKNRKRAFRWYKVDEADADTANFIYYLGLLAGQEQLLQEALPLLTPEYRQGGSSAFFRVFFRGLYQRLPANTVLVLDNCQDAGNDAFHEMLAIALQEIPPDVQLIILSRERPPAQLARLITSRQLCLLDQDALSLTAEEILGICKLQQKVVTPEFVQHIHDSTRGWAAGVMLLLEQEKAPRAAPAMLTNRAQQALFDYFASEVLHHADAQLRELLLNTAYLPHISIDAAVNLTQNKQAGDLLHALAVRNYFTYQHEADTAYYEYHPLFAAFLKKQLEAFYDRNAINALRQRSATLLLAGEQFEQAFELFIELGDWHSAVDIILTQAQSFLQQGRDQVIRQWIQHLPDAILTEYHWLNYWLGASILAINPAEGIHHFERAFAGFKQEADVAGCYLAWAGVMECLWIPMVPAPMRVWISVFEQLQAQYPEFPSLAIEVRVTGLLVLALFWSSPAHPRFAYWVERAMGLWQQDVDDMLRLDLVNRLYLCFSITGNLVRAREIKTISAGLLARVKSPLATLFGYMVSMYHCGASGEYQKGLQLLDEATHLQDETGIYVYAPLILCFGTRLAILAGETAKADCLLQQIGHLLAPATENVDKAHYYFLKSWHALETGDYLAANDYADMAVHLSRHFTAHYPLCESLFVKVMVLLAMGQLEQAEALQRELTQLSDHVDYQWLEYSALLARFYIENIQQNGHLLETLRDTVIIACHNDYAMPFAYPKKVMAGLYRLALENDIETAFVTRKIRHTRLGPDKPSTAVWPWPVRIWTLGRFALEVNGKDVDLAGNKHRRPCDLLKLLLTSAPHGMAEQHLAEALWPGLEGDAAMRNLRTNLHRLRRLLGSEQAVLVQQGRTRLNPQYGWIDATELDHLLASIATIDADQLQALADGLPCIYHGPFLAGEDEPHILAYRQRLQQHVMTGLSQLEARLRTAQLNDAASALYAQLAERLAED